MDVSTKLLNGALSALRVDPCSLPQCTRLRGEDYGHLCRHAVANTNLRIVFAFGPKADEITVLAIGRHDDTSENVYRQLAHLLGVTYDEGRFKKAKEPCCGGGYPRRLTRAERQTLSERAWAKASKGSKSRA